MNNQYLGDPTGGYNCTEFVCGSGCKGEVKTVDIYLRGEYSCTRVFCAGRMALFQRPDAECVLQ